MVKVTQCVEGSTAMNIDDTGNAILEVGIISGYDITTESAITKMMNLFGEGYEPDKVREYMKCDLIGEMTIHDTKEN